MDLGSYKARLRAILEAALRPGLDYHEDFEADAASCHQLGLPLLDAAGLLAPRMIGELRRGLPEVPRFSLRKLNGSASILDVGEFDSREMAYRGAAALGPGHYLIGPRDSPPDERVQVEALGGVIVTSTPRRWVAPYEDTGSGQPD